MVEDIQSVPKAKDTFTIFLTDTKLLGGVRSIKNLYPPLCMLHKMSHALQRSIVAGQRPRRYDKDHVMPHAHINERVLHTFYIDA